MCFNSEIKNTNGKMKNIETNFVLKLFKLGVIGLELSPFELLSGGDGTKNCICVNY